MLKIGVVGGIKIYGGNSMKDEIKWNTRIYGQRDSYY